MVLALVLLPALAGALERRRAAAAPAIASAAGHRRSSRSPASSRSCWSSARRVIPWLLHWVAHTGSRELFRLAVLAIALGVAFGAAMLFDVSFALGAFFAGMILGETELSHRAAEETLPLRDAFAVLFFVSVGMLFDPAVLIEQPLPLLATVRDHHRRQVDRGLRDRARVRPSDADRADRRRPAWRRSASSRSSSPALGVGAAACCRRRAAT